MLSRDLRNAHKKITIIFYHDDIYTHSLYTKKKTNDCKFYRHVIYSVKLELTLYIDIGIEIYRKNPSLQFSQQILLIICPSDEILVDQT